jgi:hypothetical protein
MQDLFFELIQVALGQREKLSHAPSEKEWSELFALSHMQSIAGVTFTALEKLNESEQKPPINLLYKWIGIYEQIRRQNELMNNEATRLTKLFESEGHHTAILKGQANALLYPIPHSRQPGDIDIWVSGGREKVVQTLQKLHLYNGKLETYATNENATETDYHIHLPENENGIVVEAHFRPSSGNLNPFTNYRLQRFLNDEINRGCTLVDEGFYVPSVKFALVMQLAHIQRHLLTEGVGLRQLMDYYYLLKSDTRKERLEVMPRLREFGLFHIAGAVMWVLKEVFGLEDEYMIAPVDERRGKIMLSIVMEGGNFGHFNPNNNITLSWSNLVYRRFKRFRLLKFDAREVIWGELHFVQFFITSLPERIRRRSWSLGVKALR